MIFPWIHDYIKVLIDVSLFRFSLISQIDTWPNSRSLDFGFQSYPYHLCYRFIKDENRICLMSRFLFSVFMNWALDCDVSVSPLCSIPVLPRCSTRPLTSLGSWVCGTQWGRTGTVHPPPLTLHTLLDNPGNITRRDKEVSLLCLMSEHLPACAEHLGGCVHS